MNKTNKRFIALMMAFIMLLSAVPSLTLAEVLKTDTSSGFRLKSITPLADTHTYEFFVEGTKQEDFTQILRDGQTLVAPATPVHPGQVFDSWQTGGAPVSFGAISVTSTQTYRVDAVFRDVYYVYFVHNGEVIATKEVTPNATTDDSGVSFTLTDPTQTFSHWDKGGQPFTFGTPITEDTTLTLVTRGAYQVLFDSQGGSAVLPGYTNTNGTITRPADPQRVGFTLLHWSQSLGGSAFNFATPLTAPTTLYAVWEGQTVNYKVAHWFENANDNGYSLAYVETKTGKAGDPVPPSVRTSQHDGILFQYFNSGAQTPQVIAGDGSTIARIDYLRNRYNLKFYTFSTTFFGEVINLTQYTNTSSNPAIPANLQVKHGANISNYWNIVTQANPGRGWFSNAYSGTVNIEAPVMPAGNLSLNGRAMSGSTYTVRFIETSTSSPFSGTPNELSTIKSLTTTPGTSGFAGGRVIPGFEWKAVYGNNNYSNPVYVYNEDSSVAPINGVVKSFYHRLSYPLHFDTQGGSVAIASLQIPFDKVISAHIPSGHLSAYTKDVTTKQESGLTYVFKGWFEDKDGLGDEYTFSENMPAFVLQVFAKWELEPVEVTYFQTMAETGETHLMIPYGLSINQAIAQNIIPSLVHSAPSGMADPQFQGWFRKDLAGKYIPFSLDEPVKTPVTLYPVYTGVPYQVTYQAGAGSGTVPTDSNPYAFGAYATMKAAPGLIPPANTVFLGWQVGGAGEILAPNTKLYIDGNKTLVAAFSAVPEKTQLTYHPNGGSGSAKTYTLLNNQTETIKPASHADLGFAKVGATFAGWNTKADGSGTTYQPNEQVMVDIINGPNTLYALWTRNTIDIKATKQWVGGHSANHNHVTLVLTRTPATSDPAVGNPLVDPPYIPGATSTADYYYFTWQNQYTHTPDGQLYTYTVTELPLPNNIRQDYVVTYEKVDGSQYNWLVKNTYNNFKSGESYKYWYTTDATLPQPTFELWRYLQGADPSTATLYKTSPVNMGNNRVQWGQYPATGPDGVPYIYFTREQPLPGYQVHYSTTTPEGWEMAVSNYKGARYRDVMVTKDWGSTPAYAQKPVVVKLMMNGNLYANTGEPKTLNAGNNWTATWSNLPNYLNNTTLNAFTVVEDTLGTGYGTPVYGISAPAVDNPATGNAKSYLKVTNSYLPQGVSATIQGKKILTGQTLTANQFTFLLSGGNLSTPMTIGNAANGSFSFTTPLFTLADLGGSETKDFTFQVKEQVPSTNPSQGMTYDTRAFQVLVKLRDNKAGALVIDSIAYTVGGASASMAEFNNKYEAKGAYDIDLGLNPTKELTGRTLKADEFSFELKKGATLIETVKNALSGNIPFSKLSYTQDDIGQTYSYTIREVIPSPGETGMTYDPMVLTFQIHIEDAGHGKLSLEVEQPEDVTFRNSYVAMGEYNIDTQLNPQKQLTGRMLKANEFIFVLRQGTQQIQSVRNTANGNIPFSPIKFTQADIGQTYTYTITEAPGRETGMTYDRMTLTFKILVEDAGNGQLKLTVTKPKDVIFNNTYKASGTFNVDTQLNPVKRLAGRALKANEFIFTLSQGSAKLQSVRNEANGNLPFKTLTFTEKDIGKTYTYTIRETLGTLNRATYDRMVLTFKITVTDAGNGRLALTLFKPLDLIFNNTFRPAPAPAPVPPPKPAAGSGISGNVGVTFE